MTEKRRIRIQYYDLDKKKTMSESFDSFRVTGRQRLGFCLLKMFGTKLKTKDIK